ncbi:winged helix-turn-helix domain-containing protein [Metapseudomonas lalkuanensis]|uniref:winged helix-turn-helix domain-containing protein n=1 Tax=Metapseudomonas lalkuanensis TaxID=2604832 RepID=UPI001CF42BA8|nr:winged helix-turn-helix domain-containing protein [Pseudomonas lalkuanensis]UCO99800.1 winged helix-turn-helix domain-containing protein [Pseudomonas lalkuanensis]
MKSQFKFLLKSGGTAVFDAANNQLHISLTSGDPRAVTLSYSESRLLQLLLDSPGDTRSRNEIMEYAWDNRVVAAGSLNQAIFTLRNLIEDGTDHELLQTVPRRGYRFNAQYVVDESTLACAAAIADAPTANEQVDAVPAAAAPTTVRESRLARLLRSPKLLVPAYGAMCCLLALVALYRLGVFDGAASDLVIEDVAAGPTTFHFVGDSAEEIARIREAFKPALDAREDGLAGHVWINRSNRLYDLSCVRTDGATENLIFLEDNPMANLQLEMVRRCMRGWP